MSGENSCFSRFLVKFLEVSAAGLATAISAYALAHFGGLLSSSPTPTPAPNEPKLPNEPRLPPPMAPTLPMLPKPRFPCDPVLPKLPIEPSEPDVPICPCWPKFPPTSTGVPSVRAVIGGLNLTVKDPADAVAAVVSRMDGGSRDLELERLRAILRDYILTGEVRRNGIGGIDATRFERSIDQLAEGFKFQKRPQLADIFDDQFLPPLNGRLVN